MLLRRSTPSTIFLFQEPLEEAADAIEELGQQIAITVVHEVAHYIGMDEKRLAELGVWMRPSRFGRRKTIIKVL